MRSRRILPSSTDENVKQGVQHQQLYHTYDLLPNDSWSQDLVSGGRWRCTDICILPTLDASSSFRTGKRNQTDTWSYRRWKRTWADYRTVKFGIDDESTMYIVWPEHSQKICRQCAGLLLIVYGWNTHRLVLKYLSSTLGYLNDFWTFGHDLRNCSTVCKISFSKINKLTQPRNGYDSTDLKLVGSLQSWWWTRWKHHQRSTPWPMQNTASHSLLRAFFRYVQRNTWSETWKLWHGLSEVQPCRLNYTELAGAEKSDETRWRM
jgi:hypothetical protein